MSRLRVPFLAAAALVLVAATGLEAGSALLRGTFDASVMRREAIRQLADSDLDDDERDEVIEETVAAGANATRPPGLAVPLLAWLDGLVILAVLLMAASLLDLKALLGKVQGVVSLVVAVVVLILVFIETIEAFVLLLVMLALLLAPPFGTLAYLAGWGFFDRGGAALVLSATLALKVGFVVLLAFAHQSFLALKRQMLMYVTTIGLTFVTALLHGFVPLVLVSITDALGAVIIGIVAIVWCIGLIVGAIVSIVKALTTAAR